MRPFEYTKLNNNTYEVFKTESKGHIISHERICIVETKDEAIKITDELNKLTYEKIELKQFKKQVFNLINKELKFVDTCSEVYNTHPDYYRGASEILELLKKEMINL